MGGSSKDSSSGGPTPEVDGSSYAGYCAGLDPVLEAVDELPPAGSLIPPSAQSRVWQFLTQQLSTGSPSAGQHKVVRPEDLQDTKQLLEVLQRHANHLCSAVEGRQGVVLAAAAAQLVADAVRHVARQQVVEKNSPAYSLLLTHGYRAGVMAVGCAGLKAQLGLRITTAPQLAHTIAAVVQAVAASITFGSSTAELEMHAQLSISFAWQRLRPYHSDSSGSNSGTSSGCPWRPSHVVVLARFVQVTESCMDPAVHDGVAAQVDTLTAAVDAMTAYADSGAPNMRSSAAGSGSSSSSGGSSAGPSAAAAAGSKGAAKKSTGSNQGSSASNASAVPQPPTGQIDMTLPLDDCPLLAAHCQLYGPVVAAVAGWPSSPSQQLPAGLRTAVKQCVVAQLAAAGSSSGRQQAWGGGRRRTLLPNTFPRSINSLPELEAAMTSMLQIYFKVPPALQQGLSPLPQLLRAVVQQVAQEQAIERNSPAFDTIIQAGLSAGMVVTACGTLHHELGVSLATSQQLLVALKVTCEAVVTPRARDQQLPFTRAAYQDLCAIAAAVSSGSAGGGGSSSSGGRAPAVPKCGWDVAFMVLCQFGGSLAFMMSCEGDMTEALAHACSPWVQLEWVNTGAFLSGGDALRSAATGALAPMMGQPVSGCAVGRSSSTPAAAAQGQEAKSCGKGQGLAGLKGLFASKPAASGAPAAPAARAKPSSSTGKGTAAAPAAAAPTSAAAAAAAKQAAAAAAAAGTGSKGSAKQSDSSSSSAGSLGFDHPMMYSPGRVIDMSLPLDDCPLLAAHCQLYEPVVAAVASLAGPPNEVRCPLALGDPVLTAVMQCLAAKLAADGSSSGQRAYGGGSRRSIVPNLPPADVRSFADLGSFMGTMTIMLATVSTTLQLVLAPLPMLVSAAVQEVARQQGVQEGSAAFDTLVQSALSAGAVAAVCASLQNELGIVLMTGKQLCEAVKFCRAAVAALEQQRANSSEAADREQRSVALTMYQGLLRISAAANSSSGGGGSSSSGNGGRGGSASSSSSGPSVAMSKCNLDVAYTVISHSCSALAYMRHCEGDVTEALAQADSSWTVVRAMLKSDMTQKFKAFVSELLPPELMGIQPESRPGTAGSSSSSSTPAAAATQGQEAESWGQGQGLAGLKGLFASKPAAAAADAAATPAAQPVAAKASSSGAVVVATSSAGKATAAAAAADVGAKAAAAAPGSSASSTASSSSSSSSSKATDPELLVPSNLKRWYCSPDTFDIIPVVPLPQDSLQLLVKLQLHTEHRDHGWNALHYACASHRVDLVEQLLAAGASVSEPEDNALLQPLHLACMGRITHEDEFYDLLETCSELESFEQYVVNSGTSCAALVELLLNNGACANAKAGLPGSELDGLRPLHILSCWHGEEGERDEDVFNNPWVGKFIMGMRHVAPLPMALLLHQAQHDFNSLTAIGRTAHPRGGGCSLRSPGALDMAFMLPAEQMAQLAASPEVLADWDEDLHLAVEHVGTVRLLLEAGAHPDFLVRSVWQTPLMMAARLGNAAVTAVLLAGGADPERMRIDGARALEIAAKEGHAVVGWTLLCYGAQVLPDWAVRGKPHPYYDGLVQVLPPPPLTHEMLVCNAIQSETVPWNCIFLQRLLAGGAGLEDVWPETGETPLLMAITYLDVDMVRVLVKAGAGVHAKLTTGPHVGDTTVAHVLFHTNKDKPRLYDNAKQIMQVLIDAGADLHSWRAEGTDYDLVQTAANRSDIDSALKLVEAGCKWQLPKGQRVLGTNIYYAPEILTTHTPTLKLAYVEGRFRLAEKVGRQKRAATATALQPWLSPDVTPECKEATLRCLVAACVTPGNVNTRQRPLLTSAPPPRVKARWADVHAQRVAAAAGSSTGQQGLGTQPGARQVSAAVDDIDALLEEIESVGGKELNAGGAAAAAAATAAAAGSKAGSKKKKKETAAQREARKKELQRVQQLQAGGSGSDSDREGEGRGSREAAGSSSAASSAVDTQAGSGAAGSGEQARKQEVVAAAADVLSSTQQQQQQAVQKQDNSQVGRAARKQQQQARASSSEAAAAAAPAGEGGVPGPAMQPARQQRTPAPPQLATEVPAAAVPAAAVPHTPPQASRAARKAATTGDAQQQVASLPMQSAGTQQQPQQQGVTVVPQGAPVAPPAAPVAVPAAAPQASPSAVPMRPAAFLPPHLRISMPAAPTAVVAPAAGCVGAAVPPPAVLSMPHPIAMQPPPPPAAQQQVTMQERPQGSALQQRMVELAKQHQLQQQAAAQKGAPAPQQQQPQPSSSTGSHVPAVPHAMMDLLQSGSAQHTSTPAAGGTTGARAAQQRPGAKRQPPAAAAAHSAGQATVQAQQNGHLPAAGVKPAAGTAAGDASVVKGPKLCLVCAQRRRNVLLIPCRHLVLCAECAEQLHGQGQLSSCPHCKKPCKQHIRVHQS